NEGFNFDDLFFQGQPDDNSQQRGPRNLQPIQSEGSGFVVRPDGYIFTNFHVVEGAEHVDVKLKDGREFPAKVIGTDEKTDIAVIKIDAKDLPVVQMGDSDAVRVGQFAFAIGAPFKLDYTFTYGVVSGKGRSKLLQARGYSISDYLQTDASINPGNSGGPLCDIDGKVIGMNTLINGMNRGLGFAIPINMAKDIGSELIAGHKIVRPWLGIRIETVGDDPTIRELFKGADKGRSEEHTSERQSRGHDRVLHHFPTRRSSDLGKVIGMNTLINGMNRGLGFAIPINMAKDIGSELIAGHKIVRPWLGIRIETVGDDPTIRELFKGADKGVVVRTIEADAPASRSNLRPFDVITQIDAAPVTSDSQLQHEILKKKVGQSVELTVWRKGQFMKVPVKTGELPDEITR